MGRKRLIVEVLVLVLLVAGCAKRPAMTGASAPAPGGAAAAPGAARPGAPAAGSPSTPTPSRPVVIGEYVANPNLKTIYFDFDKSQVRPGDAKILDGNGTWLKSNPGQLILIEGHCDDRGTNEYNLALGERRARATQSYLVSQGIAVRRITIISYGEERPICKEQDEACWAKNRRANFLTKKE